MTETWDKGFMLDWERLAQVVLRASMDARYPSTRFAVGRFNRRFKGIAAKLRAAGLSDAWNDDVKEAMDETFSTFQPQGSSEAGPDDGGIRRAVRIGYALVTKNSAMMSPEEGRLVRPLLHSEWTAFLPPDPEVPEPSPTVGSFSVDALVPWSREPRGNRRSSRLVGTGIVVNVDTVDPEEASVAWRLKAGEGEGWLYVWSFEGRLYRPVLAPDTWRPITVPEFRRAAAGLVAWQDNPFVASAKDQRSSMAIIEYTVPHDGKDEAAKGIVEEAVARAGLFLSIGGVVYRSTSEPVLRLASRVGTPGQEGLVYFAAWDLGNLSYASDQGTMLGPEPKARLVDCFRAEGSQKKLVDYAGLGLVGDTFLHGYEERDPVLERLSGHPGDPIQESLRALGEALVEARERIGVVVPADPTDPEAVKEALAGCPYTGIGQLARALNDCVVFARRGAFDDGDTLDEEVVASMSF